MKITISIGRKKHLDDCVQAMFDSQLGQIYFSKESEAAAYLQDGIKKKEILVAFNEKNECIGFMWYVLNGMFYRFPYLRDIVVKKEFRSQGAGTQMISYFERQGFRHASSLFLIVGDFNSAAKKLYKKLGYEEVGIIPGLLETGISETLMMKQSS